MVSIEIIEGEHKRGQLFMEFLSERVSQSYVSFVNIIH
jgi:hypothetical protein